MVGGRMRAGRRAHSRFYGRRRPNTADVQVQPTRVAGRGLEHTGYVELADDPPAGSTRLVGRVRRRPFPVLCHEYLAPGESLPPEIGRLSGRRHEARELPARPGCRFPSLKAQMHRFRLQLHPTFAE